MKKITVVINTGSPYSTENLEKKFSYKMEKPGERLLLKAIEDSLRKFKIARLIINIGFIKIFEGNKELYNSDFMGINDKFVYNKTIKS